ncbi:MAG: lysine--tRNA ligase [bacterium]|nr:lysine--tRNA ligase [bacterium]
MFWADRVASELKDKGPQWVDDMKTPSGRIHVGALRGVIIHDLVFRALKDPKTPAKYTYIIDDHDPMDSLPIYLDQEKYAPYMGVPLNKIPSPDGSQKSFARYFAENFINVFNKLGCRPEILWAWDFYTSGKIDKAIRTALDNAEKIQDIYQKVSGSQKKEAGWYPFQVICEKCGKLGTTKVTAWDGKEVTYECLPDLVKWAQGCGFKGKISPFSGKGKLPWKVEWPAVWSILGVTIEGEGKDLASRGGARDTANALCREVFKIKPPYDLPYEHFLIGGKKMSTSKGFGASAQEMAEILPPQVLRFLMVKTDYKQAINFDPEGETILQLFDDYDRYAKEFFNHGNEDLSRVFELSQIDSTLPKKMTFPRFREVATFVQMPGVDIKKQFPDASPEILEERIKYAKIWLEKYAPEEKKFTVQKNLPPAAKILTTGQKELLLKITQDVDKKWEPEDFQNHIYQLGKEAGLTSNETFQAIYLALLGKNHGPKASWLILSLEKDFVQKRFQEAAK